MVYRVVGAGDFPWSGPIPDHRGLDAIGRESRLGHRLPIRCLSAVSDYAGLGADCCLQCSLPALSTAGGMVGVRALPLRRAALLAVLGWWLAVRVFAIHPGGDDP